MSKIVKYVIANKLFLISLIVFNLFISSWNYSYLIISEGWFLLPAKLINEGQLPYRDFYAYLPPFYYWYSYFLFLLGDELIFNARVAGQLVFSLIFYFSYEFYRINFNKIVSLISTFVSLLIYLNTNAIFTYDFTHLVTLFYLIAFFFILKSKKSNSSAFLSGFFGTLLVLTKQSNGSVIFFFLVFIFLLINKENIRRIYLPFLGGLLAGLPFLIHIISYGGLGDFVDQVVFQAGSTKGGIYHSLTTLFPPTSSYYSLNTLKYFLFEIFFPLFIFIFISIRSNKNSFLWKDDFKNNQNLWILLSLLICAILTIYFSLPSIKDTPFGSYILSYYWNRAFVWSGYYAIAILLLFNKYNFFNRESLLFLISLIFASATSAGLTPTSIYLHLGFLIAILLSMKSFLNILKYTGFVFAIILTISSIQGRDSIQYQWWGYLSLKGSNLSYEIPAIRKIKNQTISRDLVLLNQKIRTCENAPKNLLSFPHAPLLNLTTGLNPPGKFTTYWFDFASNQNVMEDLNRLKGSKLDLIAIVHLEESAYTGHNSLFRNNNGLSQTVMLDYIAQITNSEEYEILLSKQISGFEVDIYYSKDLKCESQ